MHTWRLDPWLGSIIAGSGAVSLFATYWDDAWHTDFGRDSAWIPPHVTLYGSVAFAGLAILVWGLTALARLRSISAVLGRPPLALAALGGGFTLAAAPADAAWHAAYGRDAVLWSPPHMLVVFASATMAIGVLAGLRTTRSGLVETAVSGLVLGSLVMAVLEYETDVPQFIEAFYLPVLLAAAMPAVLVTRRLVPRRHAVLRMIAAYALTRLLTTVVLVIMERSAPDLPLAIIGLAAMELPWRSTFERYTAGAAGVAAAAWTSAALGWTSQSPASVGAVALPVLAVWLLCLAAARRRSPVLGAAAAALIGIVLVVSPGRPARAHDPGQGKPYAEVRLSAVTDNAGVTHLVVLPESRCNEMQPLRAVARRAGREIIGRLAPVGGCRFEGALRLPRGDLWFVYGEFRTSGGGDVETWMPFRTGDRTTVALRRELYRPAGGGDVTGGQIAWGAVLYGVGLSLLAAALVLTRARRKPAGR